MKVEVLVLAAGEGKRMNSSLPKVLHPLAGRPLLQHVLNTAQSLNPDHCHVVVGHGAQEVSQALAANPVNWVQQQEQLGTGHAVAQALPAVDDDAIVLVLYGDVPLVSVQTLQQLVSAAQDNAALLTAVVTAPDGYGRILRDQNGELIAVVEDKDASEQQRQITEINSGILAAPARLLKNWLPQVKNDNAQGEYYLPDVLALSVAEGRGVSTVLASNELDILGVNDRVQLNLLERECQRRQALELLRSGTGLADAQRLDIRGELQCGEEVFIDINVLLQGSVSLGDGCTIGANCVLIDCTIGAGVEIKPFSHLEGVVVGDDCVIGPFARLRPDTQLEQGVRIGNFVETKKSYIGQGSKVNHLSYIGDATLGSNVNIGAGTITCNYDGANKYPTTLGDGVFVGSNSTLVAPLEVERNGFIGAGSTITKAVAEDQLAISRARQRNLDGWRRPVKKDA